MKIDIMDKKWWMIARIPEFLSTKCIGYIKDLTLYSMYVHGIKHFVVSISFSLANFAVSTYFMPYISNMD